MAEKTKKFEKVRSAGRFGARYGVGIRKKLLKVEDKQKQKYPCPACGFKRVKRLSKGIFKCKKCGHNFTGGAYIPYTQTGQIIRKIVTQKKFLPYMEELIKSTEITKGLASEGETTDEKESTKKRKEEKNTAERKTSKEGAS